MMKPVTHEICISLFKAEAFYKAVQMCTDCFMIFSIDKISVRAIEDGVLFIQITAESPSTFFHLGDNTQFFNDRKYIPL